MLGVPIMFSGDWRGAFLVENPLVCGGFRGRLFASKDNQMAAISGWNGSYGTMRPGGRVRHLTSVIGGMSDVQWVQNSRWRGAFLAWNHHV